MNNILRRQFFSLSSDMYIKTAAKLNQKFFPYWSVSNSPKFFSILQPISRNCLYLQGGYNLNSSLSISLFSNPIKPVIKSSLVNYSYRQISGRPQRKLSRQYVNSVKLFMCSWANRGVHKGREYWKLNVVRATQHFSHHGRNRLAKLKQQMQMKKERFRKILYTGNRRFCHLKSNIKSRKEHIKKLKEKTLERSKQAKRGAIALWKKYGYVGIGVYLGVYFVTLGSFYAAVNCGIVTAELVKGWVEVLHLGTHINPDTIQRVDTEWGKLVLAWVATKVVEPLRLFFAVSITPSVARILKQFRIKR